MFKKVTDENANKLVEAASIEELNTSQLHEVVGAHRIAFSYKSSDDDPRLYAG